MRYLLACLTALALFSVVEAQNTEPDGTLLSSSLGLPQSLISLPVFSKPGTAPVGAGIVAPAKPVAKPSAAKPSTATKPSTTAKPATSSQKKPSSSAAQKPVAKAPAKKPVVSTAQRSGPSYVVKSTAYNSHVSQTDRTPHITATGARTRFGVVALSRDLLRSIPYGSLVRIEDLGAWGSGRGRGTYNRMLSGVTFQVEDTMHPRKVRTVDVWFYSRSEALRWGARQVKITVLRFGRR